MIPLALLLFFLSNCTSFDDPSLMLLLRIIITGSNSSKNEHKSEANRWCNYVNSHRRLRSINWKILSLFNSSILALPAHLLNAAASLFRLIKQARLGGDVSEPGFSKNLRVICNIIYAFDGVE